MDTVDSGGRKGRLSALIATIVILAAWMVGCAPASPTISVALSGTPETLDPHRTTSTLTFQVTRSIYDTLFEPNRDGEIVPALATEWSYSGDGTVLTISLREGVQFHDGTVLTAADVVASIGRMQHADSPRSADYAVISELSAVDAHTVEMILDEPTPTLIATLSSGWSAIMSKQSIEQGHNHAIEPYGTGPYRLVNIEVGNSIALEKFDGYWGAPMPFVSQLVFNVISESLLKVQGLMDGSVDVVDIIEPETLPLLEADEAIEVERSLSGLAMVVPINTANPYLNNITMRQAIAHAIDRQEVLKRAYGGGEIIASFMDYSDPYYPANIEQVYPFDRERARQLVAELRQQDGAFPSEPFVMRVPQNFQPHIRAAEIYQQQLSEVGIPVAIELVEWPTWIEEVYLGGLYDLTVIGHTGHLDPAPRFDEIAYTGWSNATFADLVQRARFEQQLGVRKQLYATALNIMAAELPFIFVGTNYRYIVTRHDVTGVVVDSKLDTFDFRNVTKR